MAEKGNELGDLAGLKSIRQIAAQLSEPTNRVRYIVDKHRVDPVTRIGSTNLFGETQITSIRQGLYGIQIRSS